MLQVEGKNRMAVCRLPLQFQVNAACNDTGCSQERSAEIATSVISSLSIMHPRARYVHVCTLWTGECV